MNRRWLVVFTLIAALAVATPGLYGQGKGKGKQSGQGATQDKGKDKDKGWDKDKDKDKDKGRDEKWESRGGFEYRTYGDRDSRPPGWSKGQKTGWGNCDVPPGQAKKGACRTYSHQGRRYYYYYDDQGRMVVRRHTPTGAGH